MSCKEKREIISTLQNAVRNLNKPLKTQRLKLFFERQKSILEKELLSVLSRSIEKYKELKTKPFFTQKLKDFATQVNFIIRECLN